MRDRSSLKEVQRWVQNFIVDPADDEVVSRSNVDAAAHLVLPSRTLSPVQRVEIYRGMYLLRMNEAIQADFPALEHFLGEAPFEELVKGYVHAFPSRSYTLSRLRDHLPEYILSVPGIARAAFAHDLARLELAMCEVFDAPESPRLDPASFARAMAGPHGKAEPTQSGVAGAPDLVPRGAAQVAGPGPVSVSQGQALTPESVALYAGITPGSVARGPILTPEAVDQTPGSAPEASGRVRMLTAEPDDQNAGSAPGPADRDPDDGCENIRLRSIEAIRVLSFRYPVNEYLQSVKDSTPHPPGRRKDSWVAVYRRDYRVWRLPLSRPAYNMLGALTQGRRLGDAIHAAGRGRAPLEAQIFKWFHMWVAEGFFSALEGG